MFFLIMIGAILEIAVWIIVAQFISGWTVFFWFIFAFIIGLMLIVSSMKSIMPALQQVQMTGHANFEGAIGKRLVWAMSGLLLAIPGLITDVLAILIMIPFMQKIVKNALMSAMAKRQQKMMQDMMNNMGMGGKNPFADMMQQMQGQRGFGQDDSIIDGEAREVKSDLKRINPPKK